MKMIGLKLRSFIKYFLEDERNRCESFRGNFGEGFYGSHLRFYDWIKLESEMVAIRQRHKT